MRRYILVFILAVIADVIAALHIYALSQSFIALAACSGFMIPFCNLLGEILFVESKKMSERVAITACTACGVAVGTAIVLKFFSFLEG